MSTPVPTPIPAYTPPPSFQQIQQQRQVEQDRTTALTTGSTTQGGSRLRRKQHRSKKRKRKRLYGGISEVARTGNASADESSAKTAGLINQMDKLAEVQKIKGGSLRKKRRLRTRKYIKVDYVRNRK